MKRHPSTYAFLEKVIDYAGLFPPSNLALETAINHYAIDINGKDSWMLGPFVLPILMIEEISPYEGLFLKRKPLNLSIVGRKSSSQDEFLTQLEADLVKIKAYVRKNHSWSKIVAYETPLPTFGETISILEEIRNGTKPLGLKVFCEVSITNGENWKGPLYSTLETIAAFNTNRNRKVRSKATYRWNYSKYVSKSRKSGICFGYMSEA